MLGLLILPILLATLDVDLSSQEVRIAPDGAGTTGRVTVVVSDEHGEGVRGLSVEDFRVEGDGFPLAATLLHRPTMGRANEYLHSDVVVVLGTMDVSERTRALSQVRHLLNRLRSYGGTRVEIVDGPLVVQEPTSDLSEAERSLATIDPRNPRRRDLLVLRAPIEAALARLSDVVSRTSLVYLVQDERLGLERYLAPNARDAGVALYPVLVRRVEIGGAFGNVQPRFVGQQGGGELSDIEWAGSSTQAYRDLQFLDGPARSTGGVSRLGGAQELAEIVAGSRGVYSFDCTIPSGLADDEVHLITVSVRRPKLTVRAVGRHLSR